MFERIEGRIVTSIVDPHRHDLDDALLKLQALADFAVKFGDQFHRIESITELGGTLRVLNLKSPKVREHVQYWQADAGVDALYIKAGTVRGTKASPHKPPSTPKAPTVQLQDELK